MIVVRRSLNAPNEWGAWVVQYWPDNAVSMGTWDTTKDRPDHYVSIEEWIDKANNENPGCVEYELWSSERIYPRD